MPAERSLRRIYVSPLFWVFAVAFVVRGVFLLRYADTSLLVPRGDDMKFYNDWALRIVHGHFTDGKAFYGMPGYAWILAAIYSVAGFNPFVPGLIQICFDAGTATLIFATAGHFFARDPVDSENCEKSGSSPTAAAVGWIAALGWITFLPAQTFSIILMPTAYLICAFWGLVLWIGATDHSSAARPWPWVGLIIGLVAVVIATILFLIPLALVQIIRTVGRNQPQPRAWGHRIAAATLLMGGMLVGTSPAWIHNYFIAHEPVILSAHSGLNLFIGNNPIANGYPKIPPGLRASQQGLLTDSIIVAEREAGRALTRAEVSRYWGDQAKKWIVENPGAWLRLIGTKIRNFWNAYPYDDISIIKILRADGIVPPGLTFGIVSALALPGLLVGLFKLPRSRWIAAAVLLHMSALLSVFITERYRLCAVPGLLLFAAYFLVQIWTWLIKRHWPAALAACAMGTVSAWAVSAPPPDLGNWSLDPYNIGIRAYEAAHDPDIARQPIRKTHELERSLAALQMAHAYVPENAEINFALANTWMALKKPEIARRFYIETLRLSPRHADAWNNMGILALEQELLPMAVRCFEMALKWEPEDAKTHYLLARTLARTGNSAGARIEIDAAIKLNPNQKEFLEFKSEIERVPSKTR